MTILKFNKLLIIFFISIKIEAYSYELRYKNDNIQKIYLQILNDSGFSFGNFFDDLRTSSSLFTYLSRYNWVINLEFHILTYRGYKKDTDNQRFRADINRTCCTILFSI